MSDALTPKPNGSMAEPLTPAQGVAAWLDLMNTCEAFLLAGLRRQVGPEGDVQAVYRRWYAERMEEHDRDMFRMIERFRQLEAGRDAVTGS